MLEVRVLGKFNVRRDGQPVELPLRAAQSLLAYLMLTVGTAHRREQLAGLLWPDMTESSAKSNLRQTLSRLRKAIGDGYLVTDDITIEFEAAAAYWLDARVIERKVEAHATADELIEAVSVYGGELLSGFYDEWVLLERERLQAAFENKMKVLLDRLVEAQRWDEVLEWGERWIALGHTPEPAYRALMLAHAGLGDLSKVAAVYHKCVEALCNELGVEPSEQTRTLYERLQREAKKRVIDVTLGVEAPRHNLPAQPSRFIGRVRELAEIEQLLNEPACRLLTLVGAGGMGKTRLALEVAQRNLDQFPAGVWLTELAPIDQDESVAPAVAGVLGVQAQPPRSLTDTVTYALQSRILLLVIDNCEHVLRGAAELVVKILERCPDTKILTTSREPLHISGEHLYTAPGLLLPEKDIATEQLSEVDSVRLFVERASAVQAGFALDAHNTADVITICRSLDGMPLAIELAAARVRALSPHEIAQRVGQQLRLLTSSQRADVPHHQTLQATIAWSYDLLTDAERTVFNRLSVFHGGCLLEAAERVCAGDGIASDDILDLLTSLVDKSMVVADTSSEGVTRYRLLETLRRYGHERLVQTGQQNAVCQRHAEYYAELAEQQEIWFLWSRLPSAHASWLAEEDNIFAALRWLSDQSDGILALRLGGVMWWCSVAWSHHRSPEYLDCLHRSFAKGGEVPPIYKAKALKAVGMCYYALGELERSLAFLEESLDLARQLENRLLIGEALGQMARVEMDLGHLDQMRVYAEECTAIGRETNGMLLFSSTLFGPLEPPEQHLALLEEFLAAALKIGAVNVGYAFQSLAEFVLYSGDLQRASSLLEESYQHYGQHGDKCGPAAPLTDLGIIALLRGDYSQATALFERSRNLWRETGWERYAAHPTRLLGRVAWCQGDSTTAARYYQESYEIDQRYSKQYGMAVASVSQATLLRDQGEYQCARTLCNEGLEILQQVNWKDDIAWALSIQGSIAQQMGESEHAVEAYQEGLSYLSESSDRILRVEVLRGLGIALASTQDGAHGARLLAFSESQCNKMGIIIPPPEQPYHDEAIRILREALDEETLTQAWQAGGAMTLEEAVAEALIEPGRNDAG